MPTSMPRRAMRASSEVSRFGADISPSAGAVSADIVHVLEPVEIDDDEGEALPAALRAPQCLLDSIVEQDAVGKFGQRITQGLGARAMEAPVESEPAHAGGQADDHERGHDPIGLLLE